MSVKVITKVWEWSRADGTALLLMLALADFCDDDGYCFPGITRIARKCRASERTVQRLICELIELGEIVRTINKGLYVEGERGPGHTNRYQLILTPKGGDIHGIKGVTSSAEGGDTAMSPKSSVETSVETSVTPPPAGPSASPRAKSKRKPSAVVFDQPQLPASINTPGVIAAWNEWLGVRKRKRAPMTEFVFSRVVSDLVAWGAVDAEKSLLQSVRSSWPNVYPVKSDRPARSPAPTVPLRSNEVPAVMDLAAEMEAERIAQESRGQ